MRKLNPNNYPPEIKETGSLIVTMKLGEPVQVIHENEIMYVTLVMTKGNQARISFSGAKTFKINRPKRKSNDGRGI